MKSKIKQFISVGSSMVLSSLTTRLFKEVNEKDESRHSVPHIVYEENQTAPVKDSSPIHAVLEPTYDMGSEQISSTLQHILSSDNILGNLPVLAHADNASFNPDYALGSESLNRMLEEILSPNFNDNAKMPYIAPAEQL